MEGMESRWRDVECGRVIGDGGEENGENRMNRV